MTVRVGLVVPFGAASAPNFGGRSPVRVSSRATALERDSCVEFAESSARAATLDSVSDGCVAF